MWKKYGRPSIYLTIVFLCGLAVGGFGYRFYELKSVSASAPVPRSPEEWKRRHLQELSDRLKLTADQRAKISDVMDQTHSEIRAFMDRTRPEMDRIQETQYARVKALLSPQQAVEYDKFHAEREKRRALAGR